MCIQPSEFRMKSALFLLIFLTGVNCMAQSNRLTVHDRNSSSKSALINSDRLKNESPIGAGSIVSMNRKNAGHLFAPKTKIAYAING